MPKFKGLTGSSRVIAAWNGLITRTTSKLEDEPIIFSTLIGSDVCRLLDFPPDQRHKELFLMQEEFPQDVVFHDGPRIAEDGLRWGTSSFRKTTTLCMTKPLDTDLKMA
jgi:hypothetical protein